MEVWKDIKDYEGLYQVSNMGRVKSLNFRNTKEPKVMTLSHNKKGYFTVMIGGKRYLVHRLVAQAFIPNPDDKPCIDHINAIRTDNRVDNLRWVTVKENNNNPIAIKNQKIAQSGKRNPYYGRTGSRHHGSKIIVQFSLDGDVINVWKSMADVSREYGVDYRDISACCRGVRKEKCNSTWKYADDIQMLGQNNIVGRLTKVLEMS